MKGLFCLFTRLCPLSSLYCYHPGEANSRSLNNKFPVVERIGATHKQKRLCFQLRPYGIVAREFIELLLYARFQHSKLNMFNGIREISDACLSTLSPQCLEINKSVSIRMLFVANEAKYFFLWHCLWCSSIDHHKSQKMRHFSCDFNSLYMGSRSNVNTSTINTGTSIISTIFRGNLVASTITKRYQAMSTLI